MHGGTVVTARSTIHPHPTTFTVLETRRPRPPDFELDAPMTPEQAAATLTPSQLAALDRTLYGFTDGITQGEPRWRKVAFVVGQALDVLHDDPDGDWPALSDMVLAARVADLVGRGHLESVGDLGAMRFSEVRRTSRVLPDA